MSAQEVIRQATVQQPDHSHAVIAMWVFVGVALIEGLLLWITYKARGGWAYVATIPFVNLRQLVSLSLAVVTVVGAGIVGYLSGVWPPEYLIDSTLLALTAWMGLDVGMYWVKRKTTDASIPSTQNIMAAQAASGGDVDARSARAAKVATLTAEMPVPNAPLPDRPDLGVPDKGVI